MGAVSLAALVAAGALFGGGSDAARRGASRRTGEPTAQTDDSVPARQVMMIGASPLEAPAETWGIGTVQSEGRPRGSVVRYAEGAGWSLAPGSLNDAGQPLSRFEPDPRAPLAGQVTPRGSGVLLGTVPEGGGSEGARRQVVLVRDPHVQQGAFQETAPVPQEGGGALLESGESLFGANRAPLTVALEEEGGARSGALVVPVQSSATDPEAGVLHWDGEDVEREPIEIPEEDREEGFPWWRSGHLTGERLAAGPARVAGAGPWLCFTEMSPGRPRAGSRSRRREANRRCAPESQR